MSRPLKIGFNSSINSRRSSSDSLPEPFPAPVTDIEPFPSARVPRLGGKVRLDCVPPAVYSKMPKFQAKVKSVLSGDSLTLTNANGQERILSLAFVTAPHLRREGDEQYAFESRDFLRRLTVGKVIMFEILYQIPNTKREYGLVYLQDGTQLPEEAVKQGWLKLRDDAGRKVLVKNR